MTGFELPVPSPRRVRFRMPASRGGLAWLAVLVIIGAFLSVQVGRQVYSNWTITQRAEEVRAELAAIRAENERLAAELEYLRSDAFVGAEARELRTLGTAGEQVLIIPPGAEAPVP
ncbi:MAG TPA: septum formation initiator family protein, partial [Candidatus Limnocylindria bacterium]|nr:septum formation initiator family protein [Candidatus Limnocylindria bacterium]